MIINYNPKISVLMSVYNKEKYLRASIESILNQTYKDFAKKVYKIRDNVRKNISKLVRNSKKIIAYGSPAKATTALNFFGISNEIECIIEDNKLKQGKFLPGMKIPITSRRNLKAKTDCLLVLAWNFFDEIKKNNSDLADKFINIKDLEN